MRVHGRYPVQYYLRPVAVVNCNGVLWERQISRTRLRRGIGMQRDDGGIHGEMQRQGAEGVEGVDDVGRINGINGINGSNGSNGINGAAFGLGFTIPIIPILP